MSFTRPLFAFLDITLLGLSAHAANTWYVDVHAAAPGDGSQASPYTSIQFAINQASVVNGDTLLVAPGDYVENVDLHFKSLTLRSIGGPEATTIRPARAGNIVYMTGDVADLDGFTVTGYIPGGFTAAIYVFNGEATIEHCIVRDNPGKGIMSFYDAFISNCTVTGNDVGVEALSFGGFVEFTDSIATHNGIDAKNDNGSAGMTLFFDFIGAGEPGFWDYANRDLHLRPGSDCIDAGNPAQHDPDGSVIDQGALTYVPTYAPPNSVYCTGKITSQGCVPAISAQGQASATSANAFWINCDQAVAHKSGLLLYGTGEQAFPAQGGLLCVTGYHRTPVQVSTGGGACTGHWQYDMNARIQSGLDPNLVPGRLIYVQWWGRDPLDPSGFGSQLSDALRFGIVP
jgi:hypothetical protein